MVSRILNWLITPPVHITDEEAQKNARLTLALCFGLALTGCIIISVSAIMSPTSIYDLDIQMSMVGTVLTVVLGVMGRWRHPTVALYGLLAIMLFLFVILPVGPVVIPALLPFAVAPLMVTGMFFPARTVAIMAIVIDVYLFLQIQRIGVSHPRYWQLQSTWYWVFLGSILVFVFIRHIAGLEALRREKLERLNQQLKESELNLEKRVALRTEELKQAKQDTQDALEKALAADRMKSQFLANMSHELRTPLNAVLNFTAFVAKGVMGPVNERQQETLNEAIDNGKHLLSLINDVLDITKIEAGMMDLFIQEVDIHEIMIATESVAKGLLKDKPVTLISEVDDALPKTFGDKRRLRQVMLNLISNAVKFTPEGQITLRAACHDTEIHIEVSDTGVGIAPEDQPLVFAAFKQAQHDLHDIVGTGLGMPICKYFVETHGGRIRLESRLGVGTTFFVDLPILPENEARAINERILGKV